MEESRLSLPGFQLRLLGIQETKGMILRFGWGHSLSLTTVPAHEQTWGDLQGKGVM